MKRYKILTAAISAAVLSGASAMAQFNYQNGDMLVAFGNGGPTDVIVDLSAISNFQQPGTPSTSWNLSSVLDSVFGSVNSSIYWAVFGVNDTTLSPYNSSVVQASPYTVWASLAESTPGVPNSTPNASGNANSQHLTENAIKTVANLTSPAAANPGFIQNFSPGVEEVASSLGGFSALMNSSSDPGAGNMGETWAYNMLNYGAGVSDLDQYNPGNPLTTPASYLGNVSLATNGLLTFNPVPEPSTWAMLGSGFLALLILHRRK